jgi:hypothetical protein
MRRFCISLAAVALVILTIVGCGGSGDGVTEVTQATDTSTTQAAETPTTQATETPTTQATAPSTTQAPETPTTQAPTGDTWTTIVTLSSSDPAWKGMEGILVSKQFAVTGEVRVVLDMPDAGELDGVIVGIVPADRATDVLALIDAVREGVVVTLRGAAPTKVVPGLDGTYVLVNSIPTSKAWSVDLQTRP